MLQLSDGRCHALNKMLNKFYQFYCRHSLFYLHLGILAVAGILCLARHFTKNPAFTDYAYAVFVLDIFSVLIHQNQKGIYHYMRMNKDVSHVPKRQIYLINTLFLTGFLILTGGFIFLFVHMPYHGIWNAIKGFFAAIARWILQFIFRKAPSPAEEIIPEDVDPFSFRPSEPRDVSLFAQILERIFTVIGVLALVAFLILLLFMLYRKITSHEKAAGVEVREFVSPKMQRDKISRSVSREKPRFFDRSVEGRIRKIYFRAVRRRIAPKQKLSKALTPSQIEDFVNLTQSPSLSQLHEAYEKARYDTEACTKEDLEKAKKGASHLT